MSVTKKFQATRILLHLASRKSSGNLLVKSNSVTWIVCFSQGKLQYAYHSLQSFKTIKNILQRYQFGDTIKTILRQGTNMLKGHKSILSLINQLAQENLITNYQKQILYRELTKDALETFCWLKQAQYQWKASASNSIGNNSLIGDLDSFLNSIKIKLQAWQELTPLISSPYQRLIFANHDILAQKIPSATFTPDTLIKLAKITNGNTIREVASVMNKKELKAIQFLLPYIKHKAIVLQPPSSPFDKLPTIPLPTQNRASLASGQLSSSNEQINNSSSVATKPQTVVSENTSPETNTFATPAIEESVKATNTTDNSAKIYKIVSIDDSPVMLEMICNYLGSEKYEVCTLENPMLSLGPIFDLKPDLILMDFSMPKINGNKLCRILRKSPVLAETPIIMVSGNLKMTDEKQLKNSGITDCLPKPFTREDLVNIVEKHL